MGCHHHTVPNHNLFLYRHALRSNIPATLSRYTWSKNVIYKQGNIKVFFTLGSRETRWGPAPRWRSRGQFSKALSTSCCFICSTVSFHNFKSQNVNLSVSNPKSKYVVYLSVLSRISNCQGLGRKNKHEILKTHRKPAPGAPYKIPCVWSLGCERLRSSA